MDGQPSQPEQPALSPTQQTEQSLLLDGLRRVTTHSPVWQLPRLIVTRELNQHLLAARRRAADSHKWEMGLLGQAVSDTDGGGISVQGDTTINNTGLKGWVAALLCLGSMLAGGSGFALYSLWNKPATPVVASKGTDVSDWRLGLRVSDKP